MRPEIITIRLSKKHKIVMPALKPLIFVEDAMTHCIREDYTSVAVTCTINYKRTFIAFRVPRVHCVDKVCRNNFTLCMFRKVD